MLNMEIINVHADKRMAPQVGLEPAEKLKPKNLGEHSWQSEAF